MNLVPRGGGGCLGGATEFDHVGRSCLAPSPSGVGLTLERASDEAQRFAVLRSLAAGVMEAADIHLTMPLPGRLCNGQSHSRSMLM